MKRIKPESGNCIFYNLAYTLTCVGIFDDYEVGYRFYFDMYKSCEGHHELVFFKDWRNSE